MADHQISIREMKDGQSGIVSQINGGHRLINRLDALGIRPGKKITRVGCSLMRGPVTIKVGRAQVAIGFGMSGKITVDTGQSHR